MHTQFINQVIRLPFRFLAYRIITGIRTDPFSLNIACKKFAITFCKLFILTRRNISNAVSSVEFCKKKNKSKFIQSIAWQSLRLLINHRTHLHIVIQGQHEIELSFQHTQILQHIVDLAQFLKACIVMTLRIAVSEQKQHTPHTN